MFDCHTPSILRALLTCAALVTVSGGACGDGGTSLAGPEPDAVYIFPRFVEAVSEDLLPQIGDNGGHVTDWTLEGTTSDRGGEWAPVGSTVLLHVNSRYYEPLELSFVVPDTVTPGADGVRRYYPVATLDRIIPAILAARWAADLTGPVLEVEVYAPNGLAGVRLKAIRIYYLACLNDHAYCDAKVDGWADRPAWQPDLSATGTQGWADLSEGWPNLDGSWSGWPSDLPPEGYGGYGESRGWQVTLNISIEDDQGHVGHAGCSPGWIPSPVLEVPCTVLFQR